MAEWIGVHGARTHNLRNLNLKLPRGQFIVFTGPSGSGKSSLAFDTIHAEGQRRFLETLGLSQRSLIRHLGRPDVDLIEGLPPTLAIGQRGGWFGPRSTLATITEIHDHLRLLWARLGIPHCHQCDTVLREHTLADIVRATLALGENCKVYLLAPLVYEEAGDQRGVFQQILQSGFLRARVDGTLTEIRDVPKLDPRRPHTIEVVVDRLVVRAGMEERLRESLAGAVKHGSGRVVITHLDDGDWADQAFSTRLECPRCRLLYPDLQPRHFSFTNPHGACPRCQGWGEVEEWDPAMVLPDRNLGLGDALRRLQDDVPEDCYVPFTPRQALGALGDVAAGMTTETPLRDWSDAALQALVRGFDPPHETWAGLIPTLDALKQQHEQQEAGDRDAFANWRRSTRCPECQGTRLNVIARSVKFGGQGLHEVTAWSVAQAAKFFEGLPADMGAGRSAKIAGAAGQVWAVLGKEIRTRLHFLREVGLGYLTLDRPAGTLSGGERQRARLASCLGGGLLGVCHVLDEPTIGLHPRDTQRLLGALRALQRQGNTVLVVEHDEAVIRQADFLVDMGPGAGQDGGHILASGPADEVLANPASVTGQALRISDCGLRIGDPISDSGMQDPGIQSAIRNPKSAISIRGARHHNLKNIDVKIPLGCLVAITGVSGSGKSSLARDVLGQAARRHLGLAAPPPGEHDAMDGLDQLDQVIEVDQRPLGRSSRSCPASYVGAFDEIRGVFATTRTAKARGYQAKRFSFNARGGRCEECQGQGRLRGAAQFLPELTVPCPACQGKRFNAATLEVTYRGKAIADVLDLTVREAVDFFANVPAVLRPLQTLADVGLGYITLGQPSSTLSGGEAQRVKLAAELARTATGRTLYLLDEPTTGLHVTDVANLVRVLRQLAKAGNTVLVVEHHLGLIAAADWVIDLGPDGGDAGGQIVAAGTPQDMAGCEQSITGRFLRSLAGKEPRTQGGLRPQPKQKE